MSEQWANAVAAWQVSDLFDPLERAAFAVMSSHLGDEEILEPTCITTLHVQHAIMARALRMELDDRDEPVVEVPAPEGFEDRDIAGDITGRG